MEGVPSGMGLKGWGIECVGRMSFLLGGGFTARVPALLCFFSHFLFFFFFCILNNEFFTVFVEVNFS